ncbi:helix-turn-helix domain-containing protein [Paenibacillus sp. PAMC21692]|uniref:response regulator transcription factor n=1 Tax=Paenibacillus sp. PAMC21692 TaxID=2762320 RepID=UPI00164ED09B|nr:helix-turn-helix domain-containing protein [Paenibacillus sp. PAMC21692]QNK58962.1 helix-turn-helix domain-containing protein [Paenibacillus sp. PAMC21692]
MYRVLIAEDEMLVRLGLKHSIDWAEYNMTVIADVANGQEAMDIYQKELPEVLITDIKMPIMDGMELIARVRGINSDAQIVILTCVEDFKTARKALAHNVQDYILKLEMTTEDMGRILLNIRKKLDQLHKPAQIKMDADIYILKDNLVKEYLLGSRYSEEEFTAKAESLNMRLRPQRVSITLMEIDSFELLCKRFKDDKGPLVRMSLLNVLNEVLANYGCGEAFADSDSRYLLVFGFDEYASEQQMTDTLHTIIEHIRNVMNMYFNISVSFVMNRAQAGYHSMKAQYSESLSKLEDRFFLGAGSNTYAGEQQSWRIPEDINRSLLQLVREWKANDAAKKALESTMLAFLTKENAVNAAEIKRTFKNWILMAALSMRLYNSNMPEIVSDYSDNIAEAQTLHELVDVFRTFLQTVGEYLSNKTTMSKEISDVIRYIDDNYKREITLNELAQVVKVSPNYLSSLFKKETGINFADYLLHYRIDRAKELLLGTFSKTYEIAEQTGFANQSYFSRAFKKLIGIGPKEFRRKWTVQREAPGGAER